MGRCFIKYKGKNKEKTLECFAESEKEAERDK
jgi:hypothetical protein